MADLEGFPHDTDRPVLVIGAAGVDLVGRVQTELTMGTSNPASIRTSFGGVARNVAENLARFGQPVILLTAVGSDSPGDQLLQQLEEAGVDTQYVMRLPDRPTGTYLAIVDERGELQFALDDMRTSASLSVEYLHDHASLFKQASVLFLDANSSPKTLRAAITLGRRNKLPICADPTSIVLANRLRPYLSRLYLVTPNNAEAGVLGERTVEVGKRRQAIEAAKYLVSQGVKIAIITLAQFGVCYATAEMVGHIPAVRTEIVDPTGAGDALTAAVIFGLLNKMPLDDALRLGVSAAALTLRHSGAVLPDQSLEKLYDQLVI